MQYPGRSARSLNFKVIPLCRAPLAMALCLISFSTACTAQTTENVKDFTDAYQHSVEHRESTKLVSMFYEPLKHRMGGEKAAIEFTQDYFHNAERFGSLPYDHRIDKIEWFQSASGQKIFLVTVTRFVDSFPTSRATRQLDVVIPDGNSGKLRMLALDCISTRWIDYAAPGFSNSKIAHRLAGEGLLNVN